MQYKKASCGCYDGFMNNLSSTLIEEDEYEFSSAMRKNNNFKNNIYFFNFKLKIIYI